MIRTLLLRGLRQHAALLIALAAGLFLFQWAVVWVAAGIDMGPEFRQFLQALLPPDVVEVILGQFGFGSFKGTVSFGFQHPFTLVAGIGMVTVLATVPAQERESGLLDLILARPLPRWTYLAASAMLVLLTSLVAPVSILAGVAAGLALVDSPQPVAWTQLLPSAGNLTLLLLAFGALALFMATAARRRGVAVARLVAVALFFYCLDFMGDYWDLLETAQKLGPFHYFDPARAAESGVSVMDAAVLGGTAVVCTLGAFLTFRGQDL
jgi:ABC-2 type transport system permease protein